MSIDAEITIEFSESNRIPNLPDEFNYKRESETRLLELETLNLFSCKFHTVKFQLMQHRKNSK